MYWCLGLLYTVTMNLDPIVFADGTDYFNQLEKKYKRHDKGLFIMTPSGAGKTYFCKQQKEPHWIDGDDLWLETGAMPESAWWDQGAHVINRVEQRCDTITAAAVDSGYWILGSANFWLKPNAIVIPTLDVLMKQIKQREQEGYDGGLKAEHLEQLITHIGIIRDWSIKFGVPEYRSVQEAVEALTKQVDF